VNLPKINPGEYAKLEKVRGVRRVEGSDSLTDDLAAIKSKLAAAQTDPEGEIFQIQGEEWVLPFAFSSCLIVTKP